MAEQPIKSIAQNSYALFGLQKLSFKISSAPNPPEVYNLAEIAGMLFSTYHFENLFKLTPDEKNAESIERDVSIPGLLFLSKCLFTYVNRHIADDMYQLDIISDYNEDKHSLNPNREKYIERGKKNAAKAKTTARKLQKKIDTIIDNHLKERNVFTYW